MASLDGSMNKTRRFFDIWKDVDCYISNTIEFIELVLSLTVSLIKHTATVFLQNSQNTRFGSVVERTEIHKQSLYSLQLIFSRFVAISATYSLWHKRNTPHHRIEAAWIFCPDGIAYRKFGSVATINYPEKMVSPFWISAAKILHFFEPKSGKIPSTNFELSKKWSLEKMDDYKSRDYWVKTINWTFSIRTTYFSSDILRLLHDRYEPFGRLSTLHRS